MQAPGKFFGCCVNEGSDIAFRAFEYAGDFFVGHAFLKAEFSTEEHFRRRVAKLAELEKKGARELSEGD